MWRIRVEYRRACCTPVIKWLGVSPLLVCIEVHEIFRDTHVTCRHSHYRASRPKEAARVNAFLVYGESPIHVLLRWPGWSMTYEPLRMTYYALFSLLHARRSPSYCSTEKHWGLLKNARSLVAMCIPRWQGKAGRNEMQVSLKAFSLQNFCNVSSSYISHLIMSVWRIQMCRNINVGNKRYVR